MTITSFSDNLRRGRDAHGRVDPRSSRFGSGFCKLRQVGSGEGRNFLLEICVLSAEDLSVYSNPNLSTYKTIRSSVQSEESCHRTLEINFCFIYYITEIPNAV